jgi:molybdopterin converting factor small subunit
VFVNGESIRYLDGAATPVGDTDEVWILPAVSGG